MKKTNYLFFLALLICLFGGNSHAIAMEVDLGLGSNPTLPQYVAFLFSWLIGIGGTLALISFTIGAVGLINPSIEAHSEAKDRMKGAVLGLVLTAAAFIIINTINTNLTKLPLPTLDKVNIQTAVAPGIYFYSKNNCTGDSSNAAASSGNIPDTFKNNLGSIKILNPTIGSNYGIILHQAAGLDNASNCSLPIITAGCHKLSMSYLSADIFLINQNPSNSGSGVTFYSEPYGWDTGANAGFYPKSINQESIGADNPEQAENIIFNYDNISRTTSYQNTCATFQDCPGSIAIDGDYLVALYTSDETCQTFDQDVPNLKAEPITASNSGKIDNVYIIPTTNGNVAPSVEQPVNPT